MKNKTLTPEQQIIATKWLAEGKILDKLFDDASTAIKNNDNKKYKELKEIMFDMVPKMCEHNRSRFSPCSACDEIEMILHPELFDDEGNRIDTDELDLNDEE